MKQSFYRTMMEDNEISTYIDANITRGVLPVKYNTIKKRLMFLDCPIRILERLDAVYKDWCKPAPPLPSLEERERTIIELIGLLPEKPPSLDDDRINWEKCGFKGHITRIYLPDHHRDKGSPIVTERDVEYHIQASNIHLAHKNREIKSWTAWVYVNRDGYLNNGRFKSVQGTDFGIQWYMH